MPRLCHISPAKREMWGCTKEPGGTSMVWALTQGSPLPSQGPLPGTVVDFWQMVWQEKTSVIVMLTGLVEHNKVSIPACAQFWSPSAQFPCFALLSTTLSKVTKHLHTSTCNAPLMKLLVLPLTDQVRAVLARAAASIWGLHCNTQQHQDHHGHC